MRPQPSTGPPGHGVAVGQAPHTDTLPTSEMKLSKVGGQARTGTPSASAPEIVAIVPNPCGRPGQQAHWKPQEVWTQRRRTHTHRPTWRLCVSLHTQARPACPRLDPPPKPDFSSLTPYTVSCSSPACWPQPCPRPAPSLSPPWAFGGTAAPPGWPRGLRRPELGDTSRPGSVFGPHRRPPLGATRPRHTPVLPLPTEPFCPFGLPHRAPSGRWGGSRSHGPAGLATARRRII